MIITKIVGGGMGIIAAIGYVFRDEIIPEPPLPVLQVYCDQLQVFDEFTTPILSGCRYEGYPVHVNMPTRHPF